MALVAALAVGLLVQSSRHTVRPKGAVRAATIDRSPPPAQAEDAALITRLDELLVSQRLYQDPNLTIARLAPRMGVPSRQISQAVNRSAGLNISQFINNQRIAQAQSLLQLSDSSVTEVMLAAGFQTKSNFNREFRRVTKQSPSEWRRSQREISPPQISFSRQVHPSLAIRLYVTMSFIMRRKNRGRAGYPLRPQHNGRSR